MLENILRKHLENFLSPRKKHIHNFEQVVFETVAHSIYDLMELGHIPYPFLEYTEEYLMEESWDLLRKITYGSWTLKDYRTLLSFGGKKKKKSA